MRPLLYFALVLLSTGSVFSQSLENHASDFPEYRWLNKRLPLDTLLSYQGDTLVLFNSDNYYVISFWFTNCPPCIAEIPWLNNLKKEYYDEKIEFIAVSFDDLEAIENLLISHPFDFDLYHLDQDIINKNGLALGYPTNLIVNNLGEVVFQKSGGSSDLDEAKKIFDILSEELKNR